MALEWTDERVALLTNWWEAGFSASECAALFAKAGVLFSRNAIIGKVHRLGFKRGDGKRTRLDRIREATRRPPPNTTPPHKIAKIIRLRKEGLPLRKIANATGVSVQAILNHVRKAGLPVAKKPPPKPKPVNVAPVEALPVMPANEGEGVTLMELGLTSCRFPLGPTLARAERFCGAHARTGSVYCAAHHALCYTPAPPRVKKRPVAVRGFNFAVAAE